MCVVIALRVLILFDVEVHPDEGKDISSAVVTAAVAVLMQVAGVSPIFSS